MIRTITLRIYSKDAPDLVPTGARKVSDTIVEATVPYEEAVRIFLMNERRRGKSGTGLTGYFVVHNSFNASEREAASHFHAWIDWTFHQLAPVEEPIPACPLCGIAEGADLCALVPPHRFAAPMAHATNGVWLLKPELAARLAKERWTGFVLAPVFTASKRRKAHLERLGLTGTPTVVPLPAEAPPMLRPLLLSRPDRAGEADLWSVVPTDFGIRFVKDSPIGSNPAVPVKLGDEPPPCGHIVGHRLLGPLEVEWDNAALRDVTFTARAVGLPKGKSLFRPVRQMVLSRKLAILLSEWSIRGLDLQPVGQASYPTGDVPLD